MTILNKRTTGLVFSMLLPVAAAAQTASHSTQKTPIDGTSAPTGRSAGIVAPPDPVEYASFCINNDDEIQDMTPCSSDADCFGNTSCGVSDGGIFDRVIAMRIPTTSAMTDTALRVTLTTLYQPNDPQPVNQPDYSTFEGEVRYLNLLRDNNGGIVTECTSSTAFGTTYPCASVGCTPEFADWATLFGGDAVFVSGNAIIPDSSYTVSNLAASCAGNEAACPDASAEVPFVTARFGNTNAGVDQRTNTTDIIITVDATKEIFGSVWKYQVSVSRLNPLPQFNSVSVTDIVLHVEAVKLTPYLNPVNACP